MSGPNSNFTQPIYSGNLYLGGSLLSCAPTALQQDPAARVSAIWFCDGGGAIQKPFIADDLPETHSRLTWTWTDQAFVEADWKVVERKANLGEPIQFIPFRPITESFILPESAAGLTRRLHRQWAKTEYASFNDTDFPNEVLLNDVSLAAAAGAPGAGEYSIDGRTLTLGDAVTASDRLDVSYYPSFRVSLSLAGETRPGWNDLTRTVIVTEIGG